MKKPNCSSPRENKSVKIEWTTPILSYIKYYTLSTPFLCVYREVLSVPVYLWLSLEHVCILNLSMNLYVLLFFKEKIRKYFIHIQQMALKVHYTKTNYEVVNTYSYLPKEDHNNHYHIIMFTNTYQRKRVQIWTTKQQK